MDRTEVDLSERWRALGRARSREDKSAALRLMQQIASAKICTDKDAAFKVEVVLERIDDGDERAALPEDLLAIAMLRQVVIHLLSRGDPIVP